MFERYFREISISSQVLFASVLVIVILSISVACAVILMAPEKWRYGVGVGLSLGAIGLSILGFVTLVTHKDCDK